MNSYPLLKYKEVLEKIVNQENHLLIGNGFNRGLGVNTSYQAIFQRMIENNRGVYRESAALVENCNYDLEEFIGKLEEDITESNNFLKKYVKNKVKLDFMQALQEIVKSEIKNIYAEKNEGIYLLLKNFTNYFTLNYDSFVYLLLLEYGRADSKKGNAIAFQPSLKFIENDLNEKNSNIYNEIKEARNQGTLKLDFGSEGGLLEKSLRTLPKNHFKNEITAYSKANNKGWKTKAIDSVIRLILSEEQEFRLLPKIDDGSVQMTLFRDKLEYVFDVESKTQNLFFLHGAFHIYQDGEYVKKITQKQDKALYERLEDILHRDEQDIVCVFQQNEKMSIIEQNKYLRNCYNKLGELSGNVVVVGSSLSENDAHIFRKINDSKVQRIFVSTLKNDAERIRRAAEMMFDSMVVDLFDAESISYENEGT